MMRDEITGILIVILLIMVIDSGCISRHSNPSIEVTATQQQTGTHVDNWIDVENTFVITLNITNNGSAIAKSVNIKYAYCNNNPIQAYCHNGTVDDLGDLQPYQSLTRYVTYNRSALSITALEKFQLTYDAETAY